MDLTSQSLPIITVLPPPHLPSVVEYTPPLILGSLASFDGEDCYRPRYLTPPLAITPIHHQAALTHFRPPIPDGGSCKGRGIGNAQFESLLNSCKQRSVQGGSRRDIDLRKEVALKVHRSKQEERRARFLAKIGAPPSPSATLLPATPPESPALFHFTLPSPGLVSPLTLFESLASEDSLGKNTAEGWVEQVEFHLSKDSGKDNRVKRMHDVRQLDPGRRPRSLPSLEEISTHFNLTGSSTEIRQRPPLPAFLSISKPQHNKPAFPPSPRVKVTSSLSVQDDSGLSFSASTLQITTSVIMRSATTSPIALTEANLQAFDQRLENSDDFHSLPKPFLSVRCNDSLHTTGERRSRRFSAPAPLIHKDAGRIQGGF